MKYLINHMEEIEIDLFIHINSRDMRQSVQKPKHDRIRSILVLLSSRLEILSKDSRV